MKKCKCIAALVLAVVLCVGLCSGVPTQAEDLLTFDRAVWINDYQIVLEFSEPIAINLLQSSRGPWISIRIVKGNNTLIWTGGSEPYGTALQWSGALQFVDEKHDRILYTISGTTMSALTVVDVMNYKGGLAEYSKNPIKMSVEEVPYDLANVAEDGFLDNVTSLDGSKRMWANKPGAYDGTYVDIVKDYSYQIDQSKLEPLKARNVYEGSILFLGDGSHKNNPDGEQQIIVKNDPATVVMFLGGAVLIAAVLIVVALLASKKRKAGK